jgi:hypothetical protein
MIELNADSLKNTIKNFFSKIGAIVLGISISFWFDEWRNDQKDREMERKILVSLRENFVQDTMNLTGTVGMADNMVKAAERLVTFRNDKEIVDSVAQFIDYAASYTGWLVNQTTYEEIKQTGKTALIQNDTLKKAILRHFTGVVPYVKEWCEVDKMHTLTYLIPEMSNYFPVVIDTMGWVTPEQKVRYIKTPKIRYLLQTGIVYKREAVNSLKMANANTKRLIGWIDRELAK